MIIPGRPFKHLQRSPFFLFSKNAKIIIINTWNETNATKMWHHKMTYFCINIRFTLIEALEPSKNVVYTYIIIKNWHTQSRFRYAEQIIYFV